MTGGTAEQRREWNRRYYENGGKEKIQAINARQRQKLREHVRGLKDNKPCMDCGFTFPHYILDFDHRDPKTKTDAIANLVGTACSLERLQEELLKCDLVCANCHRARTYKMFRAPVAQFGSAAPS